MWKCKNMNDVVSKESSGLSSRYLVVRGCGTAELASLGPSPPKIIGYCALLAQPCCRFMVPFRRGLR